MNVEVVGNNININTEPTTLSLISEESTIIKNYTNKNDLQVVNQDQEIEVVLPKEVAGKSWIKDVYVNGQSVIDENGIAQIRIPDTSEFITKSVNDLINYYNKEEINELAMSIQTVNIVVVDTLPTIGESNVIYFVKKDGSENDIYDEWIYINNKWEHIGNTEISLDDYATKKWVESKKYMPIEDFQEYINFFHYTKTEVDSKVKEVDDKITNLSENVYKKDETYNKDELDAKLENLPTGGTELVAGDNTVIEDSHINVYTNTGYIISDADVKAQAISDSGTTGINEIVYDNESEIMVIYDKTAKIRRSENGIDFKLITLPFTCRSMFINPNNRRIFGLCTGYFIYSDDDGSTWNSSQNTYASSLNYIARAQGHVTGFAGVNKSIKRIYTFDANFKQTGYITSVIVPEFMTQFADHQFIWCNSAGTFKYGAGSNEGDFASLTGVTVNVLRNINGYPVIGLKNNNKIYVLKNYSGVTGNEWVEYTLPEICTVNDIVLNPNDQMYYIFTDINTYYKTKDFIEYENLEVDGLRGIQGSFTLAGIQMTTDDHNTLLLCPARTKQENKNQEVKRNQDKTKMVGKGLELDETGRFNVKSATDKIGVNANGLFLALIDKDGLTEDVLEALYTALATSKTIDPYEIENWYFGEGYPENDLYASQKFVFTQDGSFLDMATWETEITVEKNEMGYIWYDQNMSIFKYVKLGNLVELLGGVLSE